MQRLLNDDIRAVRVEAAWALHESIDTNTPAGREMLQSLMFNCDQPAGAAQLGSFLFARGDASNALPWFEKAVAWDAHSAPLHDALAVCLSTLGRRGDAVSELEHACRIVPRDAQYRYKLGLGLSEAGRLNDAVAALEESVKLEPNVASAWYNLGLGYSQQNRPEEALTALTRAESLDASSARIPYARATILARTGRNDEARRASARALELQRDFSEARTLFEMLGK
jgi:tetratricopeptide (TPR) repeat protein